MIGILLSLLKSRYSADTYLFTEPLYVDLGQLFARHQALNPPIQGGYRGLLRSWGQSRWLGRPTDILHIGIHDVRAPLYCSDSGCWWGASLNDGKFEDCLVYSSKADQEILKVKLYRE